MGLVDAIVEKTSDVDEDVRAASVHALGEFMTSGERIRQPYETDAY